MADVTRRGMLTGIWHNAGTAIRPPWSGDQAHFLTQCTRCGDCLQVCASGVLRRGPGGYPVVDFRHGECTFCYACASACGASFFLPRHARTWDLVARIGRGCLAQWSVECRRCQESCEGAAISFQPSQRGIWQPRLEATLCSGCGACVSVCPVSAIEVENGHEESLAGM